MKRTVFFLILTLIVTMFLSHNCVLANNKKLNIAMLLWRGETKAEQGFKDGLRGVGYKVRYTVFNADQKRDKMADILRLQLYNNLKNFDYIYSFGTTTSKMAKTLIHNQIPHIFNIVTAPVESGIVRSMKSSNANISGVSHRISLLQQLTTALKIRSFRRVGFFFNTREKNSEITLRNLIRIAYTLNLKIEIFPCAPGSKRLEMKLLEIVNGSIKLDAVYLPLDSFIVSNASLIGKRLREAKVMSIGAQREYIDNGALMGIIPDYYSLGKLASKIVVRHQRGEKLSNIPIQTVQRPKFIINETTRKILNINIPRGILKRAVIVKNDLKS